MNARDDDREQTASISIRDTIFEGNPQSILERREPSRLPMLIMQGWLDDTCFRPSRKIAATYRLSAACASSPCSRGSEHEWVAKPGPRPIVAREMGRRSSRASSRRDA